MLKQHKPNYLKSLFLDTLKRQIVWGPSADTDGDHQALAQFPPKLTQAVPMLDSGG